MKTAAFPTPLKNAPLWPLSVEAYHALGEAGLIPKNTELLYGFVYNKMSKSPLHSGLVRRSLRRLRAATLPGCFITSEQPITCVDSEPEPDAAVIRGEEDALTDHPKTAELVIEVCVTSHDYDRSKLRAYADANVKEVWLVLAPEKQVEVHRQPADGAYSQIALHGPGGKLTAAALPSFTLDLDELFAP